jgi:hypothetical protein
MGVRVGTDPQNGIVKTGYWLRTSQQQWLRQEAFRRGITASQLLRELLDASIRQTTPQPESEGAER